MLSSVLLPISNFAIDRCRWSFFGSDAYQGMKRQFYFEPQERALCQATTIWLPKDATGRVVGRKITLRLCMPRTSKIEDTGESTRMLPHTKIFDMQVMSVTKFRFASFRVSGGAVCCG